jgi:hypothetical protein
MGLQFRKAKSKKRNRKAKRKLWKVTQKASWQENSVKVLEARGGIEPPIKVLQTFALPLGDRAPGSGKNQAHKLWHSRSDSFRAKS